MSRGAHGIQLQHRKQKAKEMVKLALDYTDIISNYWESEHQIVAKTGTSFPRVLWSYGEALYIDFNESPDEKFTPISVYGEKEVSMNVGGNPEKVKRAFLANLDFVRSLDSQELERRLRNANRQTKNNRNRGAQGAAQSQNQRGSPQPQQATRGQPQQTTKGQPQQATRGQPQQATRGQPQQANQGQSHQTTRGQPQQTTRGQHQNKHAGIRSKQVQNPNQLSSGTSSLFKIIVLIFAVFFILALLTLTATP